MRNGNTIRSGLVGAADGVSRSGNRRIPGRLFRSDLAAAKAFRPQCLTRSFQWLKMRNRESASS